jgi:hypothetical protein
MDSGADVESRVKGVEVRGDGHCVTFSSRGDASGWDDQLAHRELKPLLWLLLLFMLLSDWVAA